MNPQFDIELFKKGDERQMKYVIEDKWRILVFVAFDYTLDTQEAENIVQEALYKVWTKRETFSNYTQLSSFLNLIIKNSCIDFRRSMFSRGKLGSRQLDIVKVNNLKKFNNFEEIVASTTVDEATDPVEYTEEEFIKMVFIQKNLPKLNNHTRRVIELILENKTREEISQELNITPRMVDRYRVKGTNVLKAYYEIVKRILG
jgi:RNA polymerase sigma factor (sigma-70 family)